MYLQRKTFVKMNRNFAMFCSTPTCRSYEFAFSTLCLFSGIEEDLIFPKEECKPLSTLYPPAVPEQTDA